MGAQNESGRRVVASELEAFETVQRTAIVKMSDGVGPGFPVLPVVALCVLVLAQRERLAELERRVASLEGK